ncbi:MAG: S8 family peptidase, partial [Deltaproteobacteria bacterium]|nr:S8 family peptidase [Deltaproteobacteria bacterium]
MDPDAFRYRHILLPPTSTTERFTSPKSGPRGPFNTPQRYRKKHSDSLLKWIEKSREHAQHYTRERTALGIDAEDGICLQFKSDPDFELKFESLEFSPSMIELLAVKETKGVTYATVFVPEGKLKYFINRIEKYRTEETKTGKFKNKDLVESISDIRIAALESLWTDEMGLFPKPNEKIWWEVWLRTGLKEDYASFFKEESSKLGLRTQVDEIRFPDRFVLLAYSDVDQMSRSVNLLNCISELRKAKENPEVFTSMSPAEQREWVDDARERIKPASIDTATVCLMDTGINKGHPLIEPHLLDDDMHAYDPSWSVTDHHSHGTEMAGLALYGDLLEILTGSEHVELNHRLESVKILPPQGQNDPRLYGFITKECVARTEVTAPYRRRAISMTVTTTDYRDRGQPSSWSAAVDQLSSGAEDGIQRLLILPAGNTELNFRHNYPNNNVTEGINDPSQAWNALCVGAFTEKVYLDPKAYPGWEPLAPSGDLSPASCTSMIWQEQWPFKPDIVLEGGNSAKVSGRDEIDYVDSLLLLTTHWQPVEKLLTVTGDTSAAASLASRMAAILLSEYPDFWPETIRALLVHSADWTPAMKSK